jgi:CheY-like chemotaxis protein
VKILVVEDQPVELKLALDVLAAAGHQVERASTADQALAAIEAEHPDVVLLDLLLPGMDGLTLARKLRADKATRDISIVIITSYPERFPSADALAADCDLYMQKPLNTRTLPAMLSDVVKRKRSPDS